MRSEIQQSIIKTLCYSQVFDYPLTASQIWKFLICGERVSPKNVKKNLNELVQKNIIGKKRGYYYLLDQENNVRIRRGRLVQSRRKMKKAAFICKVLKFIPTVRLIGISGSLSMFNSGDHDDIDLFIITRENTLWLTRLTVLFLLTAFGMRRKRNDHYAQDKICPNMFLSESHLAFKGDDQNLFIAHEIAQLYIFIDKGDIYKKFLAENGWVKKLLPNLDIPQSTKPKNLRSDTLFYHFEKIFYFLQSFYMRNHKTSEKVDFVSARFHPEDRKDMILEQYYNMYTRYSLLLQDLDMTSSFGYSTTRIHQPLVSLS